MTFFRIGKGDMWHIGYDKSTDNAFNGKDYVHLLLKLVLVDFDP